MAFLCILHLSNLRVIRLIQFMYILLWYQKINLFVTSINLDNFNFSLILS